MKLIDIDVGGKIVPYDNDIWNEDDIIDIPLWESAKQNKCTLSEQEKREILSLLQESLNSDDFIEVDWV